MDLEEYRSAARQIAEYAKRSAKKRGKSIVILDGNIMKVVIEDPNTANY